jgi:peptidoglycan/xylan/chitin deacetylase (PgdA/CDA1 family)
MMHIGLLKWAAVILPLAFFHSLYASNGQELPPGPNVAHSALLKNSAVVDRLDAYWQRAQQEIYKSSEEIAAQVKRDKRRGTYLPVLVRGNTEGKKIALTFDDGPHPMYTAELLAILEREKVPATFFVIGFMAERYPAQIRDEMAGGFAIENHTFSHVTLTHLPPEEIETEYKACSDVIYKITGKYPTYCRPPGGDYDMDVVRSAQVLGLTTVLWTDDPGDYLNPGTLKLEEETLRNMTSGGIVLLHDGAPETLTVLPQIIEYAKRHGYHFVTLDELK